MCLIHRKQNIPPQILVTLRDVVNHAGHRHHGQRHLGFIPLTGQMPQVNQRHIRFRPQRPLPVKQLRLKTARLGEHPQRFRHLCRFCPPEFISLTVPGDFPQCRLQIRRQHLASLPVCGVRGHQQGFADHCPVRPFECGLFLRIPPGDHHAGRNLHFSQNVALLLIFVLRVIINIRQCLLIHILQGLSLCHQEMRIRKRRQADAGARFHADFVDAQPEALKIIGQQPERVTSLSNKKTGAMYGHDLRQRGAQRGGFPGAGRAKQQQVRVLGAIQFIQRIKGQHIPTPVKETESGMAGARLPPGHRQEPRQMLHPHQTRVPLLPVRIRVKTHGQRTQPAVQWPHIKLRAYRLQAGAQQCRGQGHPLTLQAVHILSP
ncbi:hypothetical protein ExPECSC017_00002 [Escherichia coli]|nr:hypothetical protein ExPECSC017_00002 [Escherichia coli]